MSTSTEILRQIWESFKFTWELVESHSSIVLFAFLVLLFILLSFWYSTH